MSHIVLLASIVIRLIRAERPRVAEAIPLAARVSAVVEEFLAMLTEGGPS
jgi:hypothetical protein